jgi:hypothetical protein
MECKERYIFDILIALPNFQSFDFRNQNDIITLIGSTKSFLKSEDARIAVKAEVNDKTASKDFQKELLYESLREVKILDNEQFFQLIILLNNENGRFIDFSDFVLHAFQTQINDTWPKLKGDIYLQVLGDKNEELAFVVNKGLDD